LKRFYPSIFRAIAILASLWLVLEFSSRSFAEILWFQEVGYLSVFLARCASQSGLWVITTLISGLFIGGNLWLASRWQWQWLPKDEWYDVGLPVTPQQRQLLGREMINTPQNRLLGKPELEKKTYSPRLKLPLLLTAAIASAVGITYILISCIALALSVWQTSSPLTHIVASFKPPLDFNLANNLANFSGFFLSYLRQLIVVLAIVGLLLWKPKTSLKAIATLLSIVLGSISALF
jgi:uncharacterized protein